MKDFTHINATSIADAETILGQYGARAKLIAGGTDLIGLLQQRALPVQPEYIVNLKTIPNMDYIREDDSGLKLGALAKLHDIAFSSVVVARYSALAASARAVASWQIRSMGTIGGNICQSTRCWYYRSSWNKFNCIRKGGDLCHAQLGNNSEASIFGAAEGCVAAHPSDIAPALVALDARIKTNKRTIAALDFFDGFRDTVLGEAEFVVEIQVPTPPSDSKQGFAKASVRQAIDFAIVNAACLITPSTGSITAARIALNSAGPKPIRATRAEESLIGKTLSGDLATSAANAALSGASALPYNRHKIQVAKGVIKEALLA